MWVKKSFSELVTSDLVTSDLRLEGQEGASHGKTWNEEAVSARVLRWNGEEK